ncbi:MAG: aminotransferase class I/II-fold pyridoxal phosphate-dependent enzyme, partial [Thermoanaerobaculia bacterium]
MFSRRTPTDFSENLIARALRVRARPYIDLTQTNPTLAGLSPSEDELRAAFGGGGASRYEPSPRGMLSAREAVCAQYARRGVAVDPGRIFLTASTSEAYSYLFKLLCDPGDCVLVPEPSYPLFDHLADLEGVRRKSYGRVETPAGPGSLDVGSVVGGLETGARALLLVNPNNPTGTYVKREEFLALLPALDPASHAVISDEVFFAFSLRESRSPRLGVAAAAPDAKVLTFSLSGLSKSCALPQVKLGWILLGGPTERVALAAERLELIADTYLSVSTPVQLALPDLFRIGRFAAARIQDRLAENLRTAVRLFRAADAANGLRPLWPEGGWT